MSRIKVDQLKPGIVIAKDLYNYDGRFLLAKGTVLSDSHLANFKRQGIEYVYIFEPETKRDNVRDFNEVYQESLDRVRSFMVDVKLGRPLDRAEINEATNVLAHQIFDEIDVFKQLRRMKLKDDYLFTHSVNVSALCILIARWLKLPEESVRELGTAGILHDIGKLYISNDILQKKDKLTAEEFEEVKKHPGLGYSLVAQEEFISHEIASAIFMHHERLDGSGYPMGLQGEAMGLYARIVAVADVYDAITSDRAYAHKESPFKAAEILWDESFGKLDPRITKIFYDRASNFYVGNRVVLSSGEQGNVIYLNPSMPTRPVVQVGDHYYDLSKEKDLTIVEILD